MSTSTPHLAALSIYLHTSLLQPTVRDKDMVPSLFLPIGAARLPHTVSGLSAGGFMAVQHHIAFSTDVDAVGVVAGGPYWCANALVAVALTSCMKQPELINVLELVQVTHNTAVTRFIDPTSSLLGDRVYLFSGTKDTEVHRGVVNKLAAYYLQMGIAPADLAEVYNVSAAHAMVTRRWGSERATGVNDRPHPSGRRSVACCTRRARGERRLIARALGMRRRSLRLHGHAVREPLRLRHRWRSPASRIRRARRCAAAAAVSRGER